MDENFESELYEQEYYWLDRPDDYNVFEEARIAEDLDIERRDREAEAEAEQLYAIVSGAIDTVLSLSDDDMDHTVEAVIEALSKAGRLA